MTGAMCILFATIFPVSNPPPKKFNEQINYPISTHKLVSILFPTNTVPQFTVSVKANIMLTFFYKFSTSGSYIEFLISQCHKLCPSFSLRSEEFKTEKLKLKSHAPSLKCSLFHTLIYSMSL